MSEDLQVIDVTTESTQVLSLLTKAELDIQITTAKAFPRKISNCLKEAVDMAVMSKEISESCIYSLPQKDSSGKDSYIVGPSVRLAEIAANCWGNLHSGARIVQNDGKTITGEAIAWDLEKNNKVTIQSSKSIVGKRGVYPVHMQNTTGKAAASIAYRNAIFKIIPKSIIDTIFKEAKKVATGSDKPIAQRINEAIIYFTKLGISETRLLELLNKESRELIDDEDLLMLLGIKNAVVDGAITIDSILKTNQGDSNSKAKALYERLKGE
ncbi:hypothetical protein UFOVP733_30 [uncultured Caudovirales phage]|uniref:Uncharacterized protein n=1 Tax=uncultured Caudovirales phage TaxID=2100421 RepID=A0A6J5NQS7_9CAUD|nr:hypothetical protein UFOVP733_30 [uncultured Caudovirales phage]CAB5224898.1 hypothetical protein UFOVP743_29 [uncultured Caudovirales phage]